MQNAIPAFEHSINKMPEHDMHDIDPNRVAYSDSEAKVSGEIWNYDCINLVEEATCVGSEAIFNDYLVMGRLLTSNIQDDTETRSAGRALGITKPVENGRVLESTFLTARILYAKHSRQHLPVWLSSCLKKGVPRYSSRSGRRFRHPWLWPLAGRCDTINPRPGLPGGYQGSHPIHFLFNQKSRHLQRASESRATGIYLSPGLYIGYGIVYTTYNVGLVIFIAMTIPCNGTVYTEYMAHVRSLSHHPLLDNVVGLNVSYLGSVKCVRGKHETGIWIGSNHKTNGSDYRQWN
jgi:hypothetical protein